MTSRGWSSEERNFLCSMRRERRQEKYLQGRENGIFLSHSHGTRMKQIIESSQENMGWPMLGCVRVRWIIKGYCCLFVALFVLTLWDNCDDTFIEKENFRGVAKGKCRKNDFPQWKERKSKDFYAFILPLKLAVLIIVLKVLLPWNNRSLRNCRVEKFFRFEKHKNFLTKGDVLE